MRALYLPIIFVAGLLGTHAAYADLRFGPASLDDSYFKLQKDSGALASLTGGTGGVLVLKPRRYGTDKAAAFRTILDQIDSTKDWKAREALTALGYDALYASEFVGKGDKRTHVTSVAVFHKGQMMALTLLDVGYRGKKRLQSKFGDLLASLRFDGGDAEALTPSGGQTLDGFYASIGAKTGLDALAQVSLEVGAKGLWLTADGRFALTESGMMGGDMDGFCQPRPKVCGRYAVRDGVFTKWRVATGQQETLRLLGRKAEPIRMAGDSIVLGKSKYLRIAPSADLRLSGQYRLLKAGARTDAGGTRSTSTVETVYGFAPDGRFFKGGYVSGFSTSPTTAIGVWTDRARRKGTYRIDGYKLTLRYEDGDAQEIAFFMFDDVPVIGGDMHEKLD
ncbi:MAG: hypothetical protein AAF557_26235 [Pseudomonadota bacterium]